MKSIEIFFKGFRFGMLLQFAIGPVSMFILKTSSTYGFYSGELGVIGVTLIDGIFILLAIKGLVSIVSRKRVQAFLKVSGAIILFLFGASTILNQFNVNLLPVLTLGSSINSSNVFINALIITASNPLTIIFWAGIFSTKLLGEKTPRHELYLFALGAILSTLFFLTMVSILGSVVKVFFPITLIRILNLIVGVVLVFLGIKILIKK